jgi:nucleoside-diphosphate-sugar epimerase
MLAAAAEA